tara:strand:- start:2581 stop:2859 length:279 start_codon:yes stop_codon:yes gene_type:complete
MKQVNFVPQGNKVLILPNPVEEITKAGIIIPDTAKKKAFVGTVVSTGEGMKDFPMSVKVGDKVVYGNRYVDLTLDDVEYLLIPEHEIIGILG